MTLGACRRSACQELRERRRLGAGPRLAISFEAKNASTITMMIGNAALLKKRLMGAPAVQEREWNCWTSDQGYQWSRAVTRQAAECGACFLWICLIGNTRQGRDIRQVPVALGVVEAVADRELVRDLEANVAGRQSRPCAAPAWSAARTPRATPGRGPPACACRYCSVSPESTMSSTIRTLRPSSGASRSLRIRTTPRGVGRRAVRRDRHEVDLARDVEVAHQVGQEEHGALEHADQQQVLALVVARDLRRHLLDAVLELVRLDEDLADVLVLEHRSAQSRASASAHPAGSSPAVTAKRSPVATPGDPGDLAAGDHHRHARRGARAGPCGR